MVAGASKENGMEIPMHKNPEWQKAHQALASISKAEAASSSKAAVGLWPVHNMSLWQSESASQQQQQYYQWYQQYNYACPFSSYAMSTCQSYSAPTTTSMRWTAPEARYSPAAVSSPAPRDSERNLQSPGMDEKPDDWLQNIKHSVEPCFTTYESEEDKDWTEKLLKEDYSFACEQMKSIQQDLTVQSIRTKFMVEVYEMYAHIALETGDHEEFNQCQTQFKSQYGENLAGNVDEFTVCPIFYYIFTKNSGDNTMELAFLTRELKADPCVSHALALRVSWALGNYLCFFGLYCPYILYVWLPCGQACRPGAPGHVQNLLPCTAHLLPAGPAGHPWACPTLARTAPACTSASAWHSCQPSEHPLSMRRVRAVVQYRLCGFCF
ncbi:hypothetical protein NN561_009027 [Cricetulus griseus]